MIENGTKVKWGSPEVKEGTVLAFIPAGEVPSRIYPDLSYTAKSRDKLGYGFHGPSSRDRYLVRVDRFHSRTGEPIAPWYYAPTKKIIEAQNKDAQPD